MDWFLFYFQGPTVHNNYVRSDFTFARDYCLDLVHDCGGRDPLPSCLKHESEAEMV